MNDSDDGIFSSAYTLEPKGGDAISVSPGLEKSSRMYRETERRYDNHFRRDRSDSIERANARNAKYAWRGRHACKVANKCRHIVNWTERK